MPKRTLLVRSLIIFPFRMFRDASGHLFAATWSRWTWKKVDLSVIFLIFQWVIHDENNHPINKISDLPIVAPKASMTVQEKMRITFHLSTFKIPQDQSPWSCSCSWSCYKILISKWHRKKLLRNIEIPYTNYLKWFMLICSGKHLFELML